MPLLRTARETQPCLNTWNWADDSHSEFTWSHTKFPFRPGTRASENIVCMPTQSICGSWVSCLTPPNNTSPSKPAILFCIVIRIRARPCTCWIWQTISDRTRNQKTRRLSYPSTIHSSTSPGLRLTYPNVNKKSRVWFKFLLNRQTCFTWILSGDVGIYCTHSSSSTGTRYILQGTHIVWIFKIIDQATVDIVAFVMWRIGIYGSDWRHWRIPCIISRRFEIVNVWGEGK